jgi:hypothetical protein
MLNLFDRLPSMLRQLSLDFTTRNVSQVEGKSILHKVAFQGYEGGVSDIKTMPAIDFSI